jgi:hypothetical protein
MMYENGAQLLIQSPDWPSIPVNIARVLGAMSKKKTRKIQGPSTHLAYLGWYLSSTVFGTVLSFVINNLYESFNNVLNSIGYA